MRKTIYVMTAAAVLLAAAPAHADAKARDGKVGLSVRGKGLRVDQAGGYMDGHGTGVRARLITYTPDGYRSALTGWKDATPVSQASVGSPSASRKRSFAAASACAGSWVPVTTQRV
ncbi:hypothetical protein [Streptomyces sp. NPDC086023]|uniref:hypothetical protein n=1 Tax=Streptomyces sp. NPDC086023 TaxID=3365746 RepID=UPI0037D50E74